MIKFLTDENISPQVISALRTKGHDVKDIKEEKKFGVSDEEVVEFARKEDRIILTCDKDFANLVKFPLQSHSGVVLLRYSNLNPTNIIKSFMPLLDTSLANRLPGALVIVRDSYIELTER